MGFAPLLTYGALAWVAAVVAAPLLVTSHSSPLVVAGAIVYRAASIVCHQIPERSFQMSAFPFAVCARCFGVYVGAAIAAIAMMLTNLPRHSRTVPLLLIIVAAMPSAGTWLAERAGFWPSSNGVRFLAAVPLGLASAWIVLDALRAERAKASGTG